MYVPIVGKFGEPSSERVWGPEGIIPQASTMKTETGPLRGKVTAYPFRVSMKEILLVERRMYDPYGGGKKWKMAIRNVP
jgi:hypothetical protein